MRVVLQLLLVAEGRSVELAASKHKIGSAEAQFLLSFELGPPLAWFEDNALFHSHHLSTFSPPIRSLHHLALAVASPLCSPRGVTRELCLLQDASFELSEHSQQKIPASDSAAHTDVESRSLTLERHQRSSCVEASSWQHWAAPPLRGQMAAKMQRRHSKEKVRHTHARCP